MADREKVVKGLECCVHTECKNCPYNGPTGTCLTLRKLHGDALELLKEQEPVEPEEIVDDFYPIGDPLRTIGWKCGHCGERIAGYDSFCPSCGKAVKWEEKT